MQPNKETPFSQIEKFLPGVEKPGRYVGGEHNQIVKDWQSVETHVALIFPDIYDIGQPNLGLAILYDILNKQPDVLAERSYAPWFDMEAHLREHKVPLYSLESKRAVKDFDIIGFTLPYESIYTNVLNILDLFGLPLFAKDRNETDPLVIAGGQAAYNPEPMSDFIDAFVLGEGEEVILEVVTAHQAWKQSKATRFELLKALARLPGVYVPALYQITYHTDGTINAITPLVPEAGLPISKRLLAKLPPPLTNFLVPNIEVVHDRISIEIMRGCTRGCRFCHAGMVNRPIRERSVDEIVEAMKQALHATGYEQIGLLSLSSSDHSCILELVTKVYERFNQARINVTLPSLRIASFSVELMDRLKELRPGGGFTIAPEAATERLRAIINKPLADQELMETVRAIFEHGWTSLKLYFMIGLPEETLEDVQAIVSMARRIQGLGRSIRGGRTRLHVGVSTFIPKPHTPFQWVPTDQPESIDRKINLLRDGLKKTGIKMTFNRSEETMLESWLARGDRRLGQVIYQAWLNGAKFDAWSEHLHIPAWLKAFETVGLEPNFYAHRQRTLDEILPWEHISVGLHKSFLIQDYQWSQEGKTRPDCRDHCYRCGILPQYEELRLNTPGSQWGCP